jgi:hypothetical protein
VTIQTIVRRTAFAVAALFFVATLFQLADRLNLVVSPPNVPESSNLVQRVDALTPYRHAIWPVFFATNFLFAVGFFALAGLGVALAARRPSGDSTRLILVWLVGIAGILGTVAFLVRVGAVQASIDIPYCDCGFKDQEIVSQVWAEMVVDGAVLWLINGASILAAIGAVLAGWLFGGREMPSAWATLSYLTGVVIALAVVLGLVAQGDASDWLTIALTGVVIPAWALWIALRFDRGATDTGARAETTG